MKAHLSSYLALFLLLFLLPFTAQAQNNSSSNDTIRLFLDCQRCERSYIRQEITFVNYVRNKEDANVHLLITRQRTGSGGTEFTLRFLGRMNFENRDKRLTYVSPNSDTEDDQRRGLVRIIKVGLTEYLAQAGALENLNITYRPSESDDVQQTADRDKWNYWVFEINGDTFFNGEESQKRLFLSLGGSADRVTEEWKINLYADYDYNRRTFSEKDSLGNETSESYITRGQRFNGSVVKSITDHWSAGLFTEAYTSSRNNIDLSTSISPGLEYNIYPYEEYSEHEISFAYLFSLERRDYSEITIYNRTSQTLLRQQLRTRLDFTQPWGEIEGRINASTYLYDLSKNKLDMRLELDFRVFRGLSLSLSGRYSLINDQLSIPKGDISDAEQLLNIREQLTSYYYSGSIGIEYSFGSIYNNIVNPRF